MSDDISVHKYAARVPMSIEQLLDAGAVTEDEARGRGWTPPPPIPWRTRLRWRVHDRWWRFRSRLGGWIAGVDFNERDDIW